MKLEWLYYNKKAKNCFYFYKAIFSSVPSAYTCTYLRWLYPPFLSFYGDCRFLQTIFSYAYVWCFQIKNNTYRIWTIEPRVLFKKIESYQVQHSNVLLNLLRIFSTLCESHKVKEPGIFLFLFCLCESQRTGVFTDILVNHEKFASTLHRCGGQNNGPPKISMFWFPECITINTKGIKAANQMTLRWGK